MQFRRVAARAVGAIAYMRRLRCVSARSGAALEQLERVHQIAGVTGKLRLDDHNRIRRELDWAQMKNGVQWVVAKCETVVT